ncbi:MAG: T9SS type A sorting domain-containing protein, partial [Lewinella sp.]|nr:T9SS type A sorting domain-containing protein [Lewinella sp.]
TSYEYDNFVYGSDSVWNDRQVEPSSEIINLFDYRARYSTYRLDSNLRRVHQQHPLIAVWDDHESANDSYTDGAENHTAATEGDWQDRKAQAKQAYFEWMPIRDNVNQQVYRSLSYGNLADLIMLDTRLEGRQEQINSIADPALQDTNRTLLGADQKQWFFDRLNNSSARWKIVGQQVIFSEFNVGWAGSAVGQSFEATESLFLDIWDGYPAERQEVINYLQDNQINNVVLLTGDFHSSFAFDVAQPPVNLQFQNIPGVGPLPFYLPSPNYDPTTGAGSVAVEFATPSVTSANFDENAGAQVAAGLQLQINNPILVGGALNLGNPNPHLKYNDLSQHGFFILDVKSDSSQADYFFTPILQPTAQASFGAGLYTRAGENHLNRAAGAAPPKTAQDVAAPRTPPVFISSVRRNVGLRDVRVLANYPNPSSGLSHLNYAVNQNSRVNIQLVNAQGQVLRQLQDAQVAAGLYTLETDVRELPKGLYYYRLTTAQGSTLQPLLVQ